MRIVILTIRTPGNIRLANRLATEFEVAGLVVLRQKIRNTREKLEFWRDNLRRHGLRKTLNKYLYLKLSSASGSKTPKGQLSAEDTEEYAFSTDRIDTEAINSDRVVEFIKSKAPQAIAVCGSNVLKPKVFTLAPYGTVNIHCGITPHYRSANPVEWAVHNREFDKIGVTIHFVNEGVDTGDVIYQQRVQIEKGDTVGSLYSRCLREGGELMVKAIKDIEARRVTPLPIPKNIGRHYLSIEYGFTQSLKVDRILRSV